MPRFLHTMIRVQNLDVSIQFYQTCMGMTLLRQTDYPSGRFTLAFLGYGDETTHTVLELTHNWDQDQPYQLGTGFGHIAIGVTNIYDTCEAIRQQGGRITREPGPMRHGTTILAFAEDPDGYKIELLER